MTPQEAVSAFFNTMRSETDQAGLMYSQFAVVQALDYVIDAKLLYFNDLSKYFC